MKFIRNIIDFFNHAATSWTMTQWSIFTVIMVIIGVICMQGFGSRKKY